jgi:hypothetical protein
MKRLFLSAAIMLLSFVAVEAKHIHLVVRDTFSGCLYTIDGDVGWSHGDVTASGCGNKFHFVWLVANPSGDDSDGSYIDINNAKMQLFRVDESGEETAIPMGEEAQALINQILPEVVKLLIEPSDEG